MSRLNAIERECQDVLVAVRDALTATQNDRPKLTYMEIMGHIRTAIMHLTNKEFGCRSGRHAMRCSCQESDAA
jgi:hypothetical protein